jgi:hypothetical protein
MLVAKAKVKNTNVRLNLFFAERRFMEKMNDSAEMLHSMPNHEVFRAQTCRKRPYLTAQLDG